MFHLGRQQRIHFTIHASYFVHHRDNERLISLFTYIINCCSFSVLTNNLVLCIVFHDAADNVYVRVVEISAPHWLFSYL